MTPKGIKARRHQQNKVKVTPKRIKARRHHRNKGKNLKVTPTESSKKSSKGDTKKN